MLNFPQKINIYICDRFSMSFVVTVFQTLPLLCRFISGVKPRRQHRDIVQQTLEGNVPTNFPLPLEDSGNWSRLILAKRENINKYIFQLLHILLLGFLEHTNAEGKSSHHMRYGYRGLIRWSMEKVVEVSKSS